MKGGHIEVPYGHMISGAVVGYFHGLDENYLLQNNTYTAQSEFEFFDPDGGWHDLVGFTGHYGLTNYGGLQNYGGWDNLTVMIDLHIDRLYENSEFELTVIYSFRPVIPVE